MNPVDQWLAINAKYLTCGGCGIWSIVDLFLIMDATRQSNAQKLFAVIG